MAVAEAVTNIASAPIAALCDIKLSCNWMAAAGHPGEDARLYDAKIRRNIKLAESCSFGQTVLDYAPRSNGAIDYTRLAEEILEPAREAAPDAKSSAPAEASAPAVTRDASSNTIAVTSS